MAAFSPFYREPGMLKKKAFYLYSTEQIVVGF
jgi:hypothetical protein